MQENNLVADGLAEELGGVVEAVHVPGVSDVLLPVLDWALAGLQSLQHENTINRCSWSGQMADGNRLATNSTLSILMRPFLVQCTQRERQSYMAFNHFHELATATSNILRGENITWSATHWDAT
jgi:hypothetical protein